MLTKSRHEVAETCCDRASRTHLACAAAVLAASVIGTATTASAQDSATIGSLPHALFCGKEGVTVVGYLARVNADGSAIYMSPSDILVEVSAKGVVDNRSGGTCSGKTLAELRDNGQARDFAE